MPAPDVLAFWKSFHLPNISSLRSRDRRSKQQPVVRPSARSIPAPHSSSTFPKATTLQDLLCETALRRGDKKILTYSTGYKAYPDSITYKDVYIRAQRIAAVVRQLDGFEEKKPVLLHLNSQIDTILWFWGVLLAHGLPVLSSPFTHVDDHRRKHIRSLCDVLENPIWITSASSLDQFAGEDRLRVYTVDTLLDQNREAAKRFQHTSLSRQSSRSSSRSKKPVGLPGEETAVLMLTSGSTGNAKAVQLSHKQILAAASGKAAVRQLPEGKPFLNWVGLDHVAALVEIHIQALCLGVDQIHVPAADIVCEPLRFLDVLSRHQVCRTFAPNFFLAKLVQSLDDKMMFLSPDTWHLQHLTVVASGGEANDAEVCKAASAIFAKHGAREDVITPGFGMTETCAGAVFNLNCPQSDISANRPYTSVGRPMEGIEVRISITDKAGNSMAADQNQIGDLEVRGDVVFEGYYRNETATIEAFTSDGWFKTGDRAILDHQGDLVLVGRTKDVININGLKISGSDVQSALERAVGSLVKSIICFPTRAPNSSTEQITVIYMPQDNPITTQGMIDINNAVSETCLLISGAKPVVFPTVNDSLLPASALGKISKAKMRTLFEEGRFDDDVAKSKLLVSEYRANTLKAPANVAESNLLDDFADVLGIDRATLEVDTPVYDMGFTSLDLIRLKNKVERRLCIEVPIMTFMRNPTARKLNVALRGLHAESEAEEREAPEAKAGEYDPVVTLRHSGSKAPLWLVHPGVGEVLVFVGLAQKLALDDRPVHTLRARGFERGHTQFTSISETVQTYLTHITRQQPHGPYAIAGYSYGSMLAFEIAKQLESVGEEVKFLGSLNLPPNIKSRMRQLNWNACLIHLAYFLGLVPESHAEEMGHSLNNLPKGEAMLSVLSIADKTRMAELQLDEQSLSKWVDIAFGLQSMARDYEPSGSVNGIDVFHAEPLRAAADGRQDWLENHLSKWSDFTREGQVRTHEVGGSHYTMLSSEHVGPFAETLMKALKDRGV